MDFPQAAYRDGFVPALLYSHAWVMTKEKLERVHRLGMPENSVLYAVSNFLWGGESVRVFAYKGPNELQIKIGYYAYSSVEDAEKQLSMFPGGLQLIWGQQVDPTQEDALKPLFDKQSAIILAHGSQHPNATRELSATADPHIRRSERNREIRQPCTSSDAYGQLTRCCAIPFHGLSPCVHISPAALFVHVVEK